MLWVFVRSVLTAINAWASNSPLDDVGLLVTWVVVFCYVASNAALLHMMSIRNMVGTRSIIVCNLVFSLCMLASLVSYSVNAWYSPPESSSDGLYLAYELFEKGSAVIFFLMATVIYCKLWSLYRFSDRNLKRRICETIPVSGVNPRIDYIAGGRTSPSCLVVFYL